MPDDSWLHRFVFTGLCGIGTSSPPVALVQPDTMIRRAITKMASIEVPSHSGAKHARRATRRSRVRA